VGAALSPPRGRPAAAALLLAGLIAAGLAGCGTREEAPPPAVRAADSLAAPAADTPLAWLDYEAGLDRAGLEGRLLLIDFTAGWCPWCEVMDRETYGDAAVRRRVREAFVPVRVDAESHRPQGGLGAPTGRDLAAEHGVAAFPATCFADSLGRPLFCLTGYLPPDRFLLALDYVASGAFTSATFAEYLAGRDGS
jgi:thioredoxin-related protein